MSKRAVLRCDGSLETGFHVTLEIRDQQLAVLTEATGELPASLALVNYLQQWQQDYYESLGASRITVEKVTIQTGMLANVERCRITAKSFQQTFREWLAAEGFQAIEQRLRELITTADSIEVLLRSRDMRLHRLPWHLWEFVERFPKTELFISSPPEQLHRPDPDVHPVRILAILGDRRGIDTEADRQALAALPNAEVVFLVEPSRQQLDHHLWEQSWDILFFAGHSQTAQQQGLLYLNQNDRLTLEELRYGLRRAINSGLQLAIFNSCDGLGLAYELEQLHIPQLIVMRQPVPDRVAQLFLKQFLKAFSSGEALHISVRQARERLQGLEREFPCASWLPMVFQNPTVPAITWSSLQGGLLRDGITISPTAIATAAVKPGWPQSRSRWSHLMTLVSSVLAVTGLVVGGRYLGLFQTLELKGYDYLIRLRPVELTDARMLVVTVTEADVQAQTTAQEPSRGSLSDVSLAKLLDRVSAYQPAAIGLDIYRDYPVSRSQTALAKRLKQDVKLFGVCKVSDEVVRDPGVASPPEMPIAQVGFSDVLMDPDRVIRRHYLAMTPPPTSPCQADYGLSTQLALTYLAQKGVNLDFTAAGEWKLGQLRFAPLQAHSGGYQRIDPSGHQILLNYRSTRELQQVAQQITLTEVLNGKLTSEMVAGKVVLIGTTAQSFRDYVLTPYQTPDGGIQELAGVMMQAHMTSQLLSAALDGRVLIRTWPLWGDMLWIGGWVLFSSGTMYVIRQLRYQIIAIGGILILLSGSCLILLQMGIWSAWVPPMIGVVIVSGILIIVNRKVLQNAK